LQAVSHLDVERKDELDTKFDTEVMRLFRTLSLDYQDVDERGWDNFESIKKRRIAAFTQTYDLPRYQWLFARYLEFVDVKNKADLHSLNFGLLYVFLVLAERDVLLFEQVVTLALSEPPGMWEPLNDYAIVHKLFQTSSLQKV